MASSSVTSQKLQKKYPTSQKRLCLSLLRTIFLKFLLHCFIFITEENNFYYFGISWETVELKFKNCRTSSIRNVKVLNNFFDLCLLKFKRLFFKKKDQFLFSIWIQRLRRNDVRHSVICFITNLVREFPWLAVRICNKVFHELVL